MELRPYQNKAVDFALKQLGDNGNSLIVAGTGAGKTIMMADCIGRYCKAFKSINGRMPHVLVLVHRTEIHSQNYKKFSWVNPDIATSEITSEKKSLHGNVHFGMVQTVAGLLPEFEKGKCFFDLIVIDEAHHAAASTYEHIIDWNKRLNPLTQLLGVTATPNRGDKMPLIHMFNNYYQITVKFLIDSHYLVRPEFVDLTPRFKLMNGDEEYGHLAKNCKNDNEGIAIINELVDDYINKKLPGKTVIFAPNHAFCKLIYDRLLEIGHTPSYLSDGIDDMTRRSEIERFESGDSEELINVDIATEGYDYPELRNLVDFDTNGTHGQWVQKVGRVLRTAPGKTTCRVIDFGGNCLMYPEGIDCDVLLEGEYKAPQGEHLTEKDFVKKEADKKVIARWIDQDEEIFTPYHYPQGFETVNDDKYGIVFVACGQNKDCIIIKNGDEVKLFATDKTALKLEYCGDFNACMTKAIDIIGNIEKSTKPITKMQILLLAPEYPTSALDFYSANCCICWKTWKKDVMEWKA